MPALRLFFFHLLLHLSFAAVIPTGPGPNDVFAAGGFCVVDWTLDTTMTWTNMTIDLMSGSNTNMTWVATVVQGVDGTDPSLVPFNWTCPDVDPYGPIYFYQFTQYSVAAVQWTARFAITSPSGEQAPAAYSDQPNGARFPWGNGSLRASSVDPVDSAMPDSPDSPDESSAPTSSINTDEQLVPSAVVRPSGLSGATYSHNSTVVPTRSRRPRPRPSSTMPIAAPTLDVPFGADDGADELYTSNACTVVGSSVSSLLSMVSVAIMLFAF